ncbi:Poli [Scenedesmus sp. PABB004]|nr:Poli [Scenedesmus sp. PABB004]
MAGPYGAGCVLHADCDAFFVQVETLRTPALAGLPVAVQQHADVIALNAAAAAAGVRKHMPPAQARALLAAAGGRLVHVFTEPDGRVSYRPYREASAALLRLLRGLPPPAGGLVAEVERGSIDEAFLAVRLDPPGGGGVVPAQDAPAWVAAHPGAVWDLSRGEAVAVALRGAARSQLGLVVSVGVAPNKLLAKLASRAAKPDGVRVVGSVAHVQALLAAAPVDRLPGAGARRGRASSPADPRRSRPPAAARRTPGFGGAVATALAAAGVRTVGALQATTAPQLAAVLGGGQAARAAERLWRLGHVEDRWPRQLRLTLLTAAAPAARSASRSCPFPPPPPSAAAPPPPAGGGSPGQRAAFNAPGVDSERSFAVPASLTDAVVAAGTALAQAVVAGVPAGLPVLQLSIAAASFGSFEGAQLGGDIRGFFAAAAPPPPTGAAAPAASPTRAPAPAPVPPATSPPRPPVAQPGDSPALAAPAAPPAAPRPPPPAAVERAAPPPQPRRNNAAPAPPAAPPRLGVHPTGVPPVLLSSLLASLADAGTTADAAEAQQAALLAAAGGPARG